MHTCICSNARSLFFSSFPFSSFPLCIKNIMHSVNRKNQNRKPIVAETLKNDKKKYFKKLKEICSPMVQDIKRTNRWPRLDSRLRPHTAHILGSYSEHPDLCHLCIPLHIPLVHHKRQRFERCNFCWRSVERHWSGSCKGRRRSQTEQSKLATDTHSPSHSHCHNTKGNCPNAHPSRSLPRSRLSSPPIIAGALFCSSTNDFFSHVLLNVGLCTMALKSLLDKGGGGEGSLSGGGGGGGGGASIVWSAWFTSTP